MIISRGRGYIFVHIPKTGGTALSLALEQRAMADDILIGDTPKARNRRGRLKGVQTAGRLWKHARLKDLPGLLEEDEMLALRVFTLVRNPWDRVVSYYHWLRAQTFDHPAVSLAQSIGFDAFIRTPLLQESLRNTPYESYVRLPSGVEKCDHFLRYERLEDEVARLADLLGIRLSLPERVNASERRRDWRTYFTDESADIIASACADDIARFDYSFEP